jgi:TolB-like protein
VASLWIREATCFRSELFYELATGKRAFERSTAAETLIAVIREEPDPLKDNVPKAFRRVVERCLAKAPSERYASAGHLLDEIKRVREGLRPAERRSRQTPEPLSSQSSVAVLPFQTIGPSQGAEYLGVGLADAIITTLARRSSIAVRSTSAVLVFDGARPDARQAGRKLRVNYVLEGRLQTLADRIRVTVQLVRTDQAEPVWADTLSASFSDLFELQETIAESVASSITKVLGRSTRAVHAPVPEAFDVYLKARTALSRNSAGPQVFEWLEPPSL